MDITKETSNPNPREDASLFSVLFFSYTLPMFKKGYSKTLEVDDLYNPLNSDRSGLLGNRLQTKWKEETSSKKSPSLMSALVRTFWPEYLILGAQIFFTDLVARFVQPLMLAGLLDYFRADSGVTKQQALWYAGIIVVFNVFMVFVGNLYIVNVFHAGMKVRVACCALIYRKAMKLSKTALGDTASGKIVNLLSNDVSRFDIVSMFIHEMWIGPVSALIVMGLLYKDAGFAGMMGILVLAVVVPFQSYTGKLTAIYRKQTAFKTDERVRLMDEVITGIQVIKMYAWEKPFAKIIQFARRAEIKIITKSSYIRALLMTFIIFTTRLALFVSLLAMTLTGEPITASKAFVFMSYFNLLSMSMGALFVRGISEIAEVFVAIKRLQDFLLNDEYEPKNLDDKITKGHDEELVILNDLNAKWNLAQDDYTLENVSLKVCDGQLVGVIGQVGCGKSSLLNAILGELVTISGKITVNGSISYASQEPWVFAATIRHNILFGAEYDKMRYQDVIKVCALERDFTQFPNGDLTIVGDRGASLSGGQRARINLARAVYRDSDIYLLDDPLSAVDIHVSKYLYEECINGYLGNRTRILVTHQVHYLKNADHIVILNNGRIEDEGTFEDLASSGNLYATLLTVEVEETDPDKKPERMRRTMRSRTSSLSSTMSHPSHPDLVITSEEDDEREVQLMDLQETSSKGTVQGSVLKQYFRAGGGWRFVLTIILLFLATQLAASGVDYWISYWVNVEEYRNSTVEINAGYIPELSTEQCLTIYGLILVALFLLAITRSVLFYKLAMWSSKKLHDLIFDSVVSARMRFFDTNPSGRILNRFSKDMGAVDEILPKSILDSGQLLLNMAGSVLLIAVINPYFLILMVFLGIVFWMMRRVFLKTSKNIKRLEGMMRSPVFTHLNGTIQGLTTIRAYGAQGILSNEFDKHQDYHTSAWYMFIAASSAFGFYLELFGAVFVGLLTFSFLTLTESLGITSGNVGLAISQATALTGMLQWGVRQTAEVSNQLMSVERILEYNELPKEIQPAQPKKPSKAWPDQGEVVLKNTGLRYYPEGPMVLNDVNLAVKPREKVGVVGRTGAGKSSLISALFRLTHVEGTIVIDGLNTSTISLEALRTKISIIPQDPVLFSGTLRYNLDPFDEYPDELLYRAIDEVELKDPANIINRLENRVMDRGSNYSVGQRQLICLARAIVRNNKILMLDEATANVDPQTDALIQKTIRKKFVDCTVITVAHRLNTIMDSDKVLVMDAGTVLEYDHPHLLLQKKDGAFNKMVNEAGKAVSEQLRKVALESYQKVPE